ncbi:hypothetical protein ACGFYZ_15505 [Streptomyces sp. NPDC048330]|uniref:hypothetical protein n=1 Tax=Streptomyces sp. NPDC048330 TaxID=3365533 RepID=UPI00371185F0
MIRRRPWLGWLLVPYVLFVAVLPLVNGVPLFVLWLLGATVLTPAAVALARRGDLREQRRWEVQVGRESQVGRAGSEGAAE